MLAMPGRPTVRPDLPVDPPLGVRRDIQRRSTELPLHPEVTMCLFTDGLIERRDSDIHADLDHLRDKMCAGPADRTCTDVLHAMIHAREIDDDVALLVLRRK
jgi:serine phosphatase RsbU (regulator of sigma subunit)